MGVSRCSRPSQGQRFRDAQAAPVEQGENRGVSRRDPRLLVERFVERDDPGRRLGRQRTGEGTLLGGRADGAERRARGCPVALQKPDQRSHPGDAPGDRPGAGAAVAAGGEEGADVGDPHVGEVGELRRLAEVAGEEAEELVDVAGISLDRIRRQPALLGKVTPPALDRLHQVGPGNDEGRFGRSCFHHAIIPAPVRLTAG